MKSRQATNLEAPPCLRFAQSHVMCTVDDVLGLIENGKEYKIKNQKGKLLVFELGLALFYFIIKKPRPSLILDKMAKPAKKSPSNLYPAHGRGLLINKLTKYLVTLGHGPGINKWYSALSLFKFIASAASRAFPAIAKSACFR